jgi:polar amino acid transport system substrate-binding protein
MLPQRVKQSGVIRIGSPRTIPPEVFMRGAEIVGIAVDLSRAMEPILGVKFDWQDMQWPGIIPGLQGGSIDVSWGILSYLPERTKLLNIIPFQKDLIGMLVQPDASGITGSNDSLCGRKIAGLQGTSYVALTDEASSECVKEKKDPIKHQVYSNNGTALVAFQSKNVEGFITSYYSALDYNKGSGGRYKVVALKELNAAPVSIATAKSENGLADAIEGALQILVKDGTYQNIMNKYGMSEAVMSASDMTVKR